MRSSNPAPMGTLLFKGLPPTDRPQHARQSAEASPGNDGVAGDAMALSLQQWLAILVACAVAGLVVLSIYGKWQVGRIYDSASYSKAHIVPGIEALRDSRAHINKQRILLYRHVVAVDAAKKAELAKQLAAAQAASNVSLQRYESRQISAEGRQFLEQDREALRRYLQGVPAVIALSAAGKTEAAIKALQQLSEVDAHLGEVLDAHVRHDTDRGLKQDADAVRIYRQAAWHTVLFVLTVVAAVLALGYVIARRINAQFVRIRALARDNDMFREMVECVKDRPVTVHDIDDGHRIVYANATACRHFGVDLETLLTWTPDRFDPHVTPELLTKFDADWATDCNFTFESTHRIATGELIPVEVSSNGFEHHGRRFYIALTRDLRPQREAEASALALQRIEDDQRNELKLARFARITPGFMYTMELRDGQMAMTYASPAIEDVLGVSVEDALADYDNLRAVVVPEDLAMLRQHAETAQRDMTMQQPMSIRHEYRICHPFKGERWVEARSQLERRADGALEWNGFLVDITGRKQMEQSLADSEYQLRSLIEGIPDNVVRYDRDLRITYINPVLEKSLGVAAESIIGRRTDELYPDVPAMLNYQLVLERVVATGKPAEYLMVAGGDGFGRELHDNIRIAPEVAANGEVVGVIAIGRDMTRQYRLEQELTRREHYQRALLDNFPFFVWLKDMDSRLLAANAQYARVAKVASTRELEGKTDFDFFPHDLARSYVADDQSVLQSGEARSVVEMYADEHGERRWMETWKSPVTVNGQVIGTVGCSRDITEQRRVTHDLAERERELRNLIENTPDVIIRYDSDCRRIYISRKYEEVYGTPVAVALGKTPTESWGRPRMTPFEYEARLRRVMESGRPDDIELDWYDEAGEYVCQSLRVAPEFDANGNVVSVLTLTRNVSELKRAERLARAREQEFRALVEHSPDTITRYDRDCRRIYANPKMREECGVSDDVLLGKTPEEFPGGEKAGAYQDRIMQVIDSGEATDFELSWRTGDGREVCSYIRLTPEFDAEGQVVSVLAVGRDITAIDAYRRQIHNLAFYDSLTDLPNRALLSDRIRQTIADASWHGRNFGLMVLDLDRFKEINDTLGHGVGDLLLREAADRLLGCVRIYDTVARLGGDEFAILLPEVRSGNDLDTIARKIIAAFNQPFMIDGRELFVSTSIGIALYPEDSADIDALFRYADSAMYHAKKQKGNNFQFYSADLTASLAGRVLIEAALRKAMGRSELELYYQPQVDLASGAIIGAEALLRWNRGAKGMVGPDKFIPVAEETGLIVGNDSPSMCLLIDSTCSLANFSFSNSSSSFK